MKTFIGLIGITMMGIGIGTFAVGLKAGACIGITLFGFGLVVDALKK